MLIKLNQRVHCENEYGKLEKVAVCSPAYMSISAGINETQKYFADEKLKRSLAIEQHTQFIQILKDHGVDVVELAADRQKPEQVFTRDIGFTVGDTVFLAEMKCQVRKGEEEVLKEWLEREQIAYKQLTGSPIEGGDVLVHGKYVYIGLSDRTAPKAVAELKGLLGSEYELVPMPFKSCYLHLDCVFNILSDEDAIIYPEAFSENEYAILSQRYELITVSSQEQFSMGTNVLSIGNRTVLSLPCNKQLNRKLRLRRYKVVEIDFSEIIKSGGSFRCCSMPLKRLNEK